jgi:outer membrane autotransporter protein
MESSPDARLHFTRFGGVVSRAKQERNRIARTNITANCDRMARSDNKDAVASTGALRKHTGFQNELKAHFTRLVVSMILSGFVGMVTAERVLATDYTTTVTAPKNGTLTLNPGDTVTTTSGSGIVADGNRSVLNAPGVTVTTSGANGFGAVAMNGGTLSITDGSKVTTSGNGAFGLFSNANGTGSTLTALSVTVTTSGTNSFGALTEDGGQLTIDRSTITTSGIRAAGLAVMPARAQGATQDSTLSVTDSSVSTTGRSAYGILLSGTTNRNTSSRVVLDNTIVTTQQAAGILSDGAENADITLNDRTRVDPGNGILLRVLGANQQRTLNLTADGNVILNGDVLVDAPSIANIYLEHHSTLTGAVNENQLTGVSGINPNKPITGTRLNVNLSIDSTSTWNMRASSTVNTLTVNPEAHINFADPPSADPFKTLVINNLVGTGGIFGMNVDLGTVKGDLIDILTKSQGEHLLTFVNRNQGTDLPEHTTLLVVRTPNGGAGFTGEVDGGTFRYFVVHGDGSSVAPVRNNWYLVRGDEITPPETETPPPTDPNPTPTSTPTPTPPGGRPTPAPTPKDQFAPGDVLPLPPQIKARLLSRVADLTSAANAAIGTYSAIMPLFYADMDTLIERLGELRLEAQKAPAPTTTISPGISKEGGKEAAPPPTMTPPAGGGVWVRGFGSESHINDQVSRSFNQDLGGFQIGADKRLVTRCGDLYLGGFLGYFHARRDFQNQPFDDDATGTTNAFSVGAYSTLIHPSGFYADLVVKYTQLWDDFDAPNFLSFLGLGCPGTADYTIPTFGASLEIGKRWDFGHFFLEPQGQIEGAWAGGADYTVSTGLRVNTDSQTSLRGRLGVRAGLHFDWGPRAFEPYAKVSVTNEFLGGDRITTNQTAFFPTLSGVGIQAAGGVTARLTDRLYVYGEYDYANSDKIRMPWAVDVGFRWQW